MSVWVLFSQQKPAGWFHSNLTAGKSVRGKQVPICFLRVHDRQHSLHLFTKEEKLQRSHQRACTCWEMLSQSSHLLWPSHAQHKPAGRLVVIVGLLTCPLVCPYPPALANPWANCSQHDYLVFPQRCWPVNTSLGAPSFPSLQHSSI